MKPEGEVVGMRVRVREGDGARGERAAAEGAGVVVVVVRGGSSDAGGEVGEGVAEPEAGDDDREDDALREV